jgi:hypothetical protein
MDAMTLGDVEARLAEDRADRTLDDAFDRFEQTQPSLADRVSQVLSRPLDDTALALGYFLSIAIWLAFERKFEKRLRTAEPEEVLAVDEALSLEAELRAERAEEPASVDDIIAQEQPDAVAFIHEHVDAALDVQAGEPPDVGDVDLVYRTSLVVLLALSHAVSKDPLAPVDPSHEMLA